MSYSSFENASQMAAFYSSDIIAYLFSGTKIFSKRGSWMDFSSWFLSHSVSLRLLLMEGDIFLHLLLCCLSIYTNVYDINIFRLSLLYATWFLVVIRWLNFLDLPNMHPPVTNNCRKSFLSMSRTMVYLVHPQKSHRQYRGRQLSSIRGFWKTSFSSLLQGCIKPWFIWLPYALSTLLFPPLICLGPWISPFLCQGVLLLFSFV